MRTPGRRFRFCLRLICFHKSLPVHDGPGEQLQEDRLLISMKPAFLSLL
jgi:hypothetical protein